MRSGFSPYLSVGWWGLHSADKVNRMETGKKLSGKKGMDKLQIINMILLQIYHMICDIA